MRSAGFAGAVLAGAGCIFWIGAADTKTYARLAAHDHDGTFAVNLVTRAGSCHKNYNTKSP